MRPVGKPPAVSQSPPTPLLLSPLPASEASCSNYFLTVTAPVIDGRLNAINCLPDAVRRCICRYLTPIDRLRLRQTCRAFYNIFADWDDVVSLEVRLKEEISAAKNPSEEFASRKSSLSFPRRFFGVKKQSQPAEKNGETGIGEDSELQAGRTRRYHVRLRLAGGGERAYSIRTTGAAGAYDAMRQLFERPTALRQLTVWDACLTSEFAAVVATHSHTLETLRLWNCGAYFVKRPSNRERMIDTLMGLPRLRELLVLDTRSAAPSFERLAADQLGERGGDASADLLANQNALSGPLDASASCGPSDDLTVGAGVAPTLHKTLATQICAPLENIQLTNVYLPMRSLELIAENCASTCTRLAIGCTFGKSAKRVGFLAAISLMRKLSDLDLPPFIFRLGKSPRLDNDMRRLIDTLPLLSIGFRHYNSSVLFRFIETQLPTTIRILRIHHNASRVPYFADLGTGGQSATRRVGDMPARLNGINASASSFSLAGDIPTPARPFSKKHSAGSYMTLSSVSSSSSSGSSVGSSSSTMNESLIGKGQADGTPSAASAGSSTALADRLRAIKARLTSSAASESVGRRFTVGSRLQLAARKKFSAASSSFSPTGDPKQRKHSLDCNNNNSDNIMTNSKYEYDTISSQQPYRNSSYSLDGRQLAQETIEETDNITLGLLKPAELARRLESRGLTIFAISEGKRSRKTRRVYKRRFCGVDCVYVAESADMQELFGRMASPMTSPYVYSKSLGGATRCAAPTVAVSMPQSALSPGTGTGSSSRYRVVHGDIVRPIPLSSLGMESDYEQSDWEDVA